MITKIATALVPALGGVLGAATAGSMSDKQRELLRKYYMLGEDSSLVMRNAGRGALGAAVGAGPGAVLGSVATTPGARLLSGAVSGIGAGLGAKYMAGKYSPEKANLVAKLLGEKLTKAEAGSTDAEVDAQMLGITNKERAALVREHGLGTGDRLALRHTLRTTAGAYGGGALGAVAGVPLAKYVSRANPRLFLAALAAPVLAGSVGGAYVMSRKYSKGAAQELLSRK